MASSVDKIFVLVQSGEVQICSRKENTDLFRHILGGYGLLALFEAWIRPVPIKVLYSSSQEVPVDRFSTVWQQITEEGPNLLTDVSQ